MPIGGASGIGWDESTPADTESAGLGDDRIRSVKTSVRQGLDAEHAWPSAGGDSVGYHRFGSARPYYGAQSLVSSSGSDGRLMQASDSSQLFGVGSGGTTFLGGPTVISAGSFPGTVPQRHQWVEEWGEDVTRSGGTVGITIPNSGYSGKPNVIVTGIHPDTGSIGQANTVVQAKLVTKTDFQVIAGAYDGLSILSGVSFMWRSIGTRVL